MTPRTQFCLTQSDIPTHWYNLLPDFPEPLPPPLHPGTQQPISPGDMLAIFPENLVRQEMSPERWIEIPEPVRDIYALWRPTPLFNLSGHGLLDLSAYESYLTGKLHDS